MKTLVIGNGGREHALARALSLDPAVAEVHAAPGNPGIADVAALHDVDPLDPAAVAGLAQRLAVDLVVVGPEAPLVAGVADAVREAGIACFGPSGAAVADLAVSLGVDLVVVGPEAPLVAGVADA
ncbi:MAG TPA: phosphoribosylamine--glycine ligase N-terminal domain-containing protein, partial [Nocardioides sp.]